MTTPISSSAAAERGLVLRGLFLLALVSGIAIAVIALLVRSAPPQANNQPKVESYPPVVLTPQAAFPAAVPWLGLYEVSERMPSAPGWQTRYTATRVLAELGSADLPWYLVHEMLDEQRQLRNFREVKDGRLVVDEPAARETVLSTLRAIATWQSKQPTGGAVPADIQAAVVELAQSPIIQVKVEAEKTRQAIAADTR